MGAISDHTRARMGRRKPYILVGTAMDLVFLTFAAWAFWNQSYWAFLVAVALLQFSSNFAQGPYQGYIPDLVPGRQVGIAPACWARRTSRATCSALGWRSSLSRCCPGSSVSLRSRWACSCDRRGRGDHHADHRLHRAGSPAPPTTKTLRERALGAWGTDLLANRDYVWLLVSRLFVLTALVSLQAFAVFFLENATTWQPDDAQTSQFPIIITVAVAAS